MSMFDEQLYTDQIHKKAVKAVPRYPAPNNIIAQSMKAEAKLQEAIDQQKNAAQTYIQNRAYLSVTFHLEYFNDDTEEWLRASADTPHASFLVDAVSVLRRDSLQQYRIIESSKVVYG